jgi:galactonate dehydratase
LRAQSTGQLKITRFVIHKASVRWRDLLFLEIHTDGGVVGLGEGSLPRKCDLVEGALRWLEQRMIGQDPAGIERHWDRNYWTLARERDGAIQRAALSAVDIALHDIEAKRLGVPVWRLLGGKVRDKHRVYFTHWNTWAKSTEPAVVAAKAAETKQAGWTAVKFAVPRHENEHVRRRMAYAFIEAVRKGGGPDLDIGLELFESFSIRSALQFAEMVAPLKPMFLEEPIWRETPQAFTGLAARSPVPIATGEGYVSRFQFKQLLDAAGAHILQPDVLFCGGITELRKIANLAEVYGIEMAPHQCFGPVGHLASLSAMSICRNFFIQEWEGEDDALFQEITGGGYPVQNNGFVALPAGPGLGITIDFEQLKKRYPYKPAIYR